MSLQQAHVEITGFTGGLNTETSPLNSSPTELLEGSVNVELRPDGSIRRRRGADFFSSLAPTIVRSGDENDEAVRESPSVFNASIATPSGRILKRVIVDLDNKFYIFDESPAALGDFSSPLQILERGVNSNALQKFYTMQFAQSSDKVYFAGRYTQPGYLQVTDDNSTLSVVYIDVNVRREAEEAASRVKVAAFSGGKRFSVTPYDDAGFRDSDIRDFDTTNETWYEAVAGHTSTLTNEPGIGPDWQKSWKRKRGAVPSGLGAWASSTLYGAGGILKKYDKNVASDASITYPTSVEFFQGRLWLGGDPQEPNTVYFSQVIIDDEDIEKFHTEADPFDTEDASAVSDDGGTLEIRGAGVIMQLLESGGSLWVATTENVKGIAGADGVFSAIKFSVSTLINEGVNSHHSLSRVGDSIFIFGVHDVWFSGLSGAGIFAKRNIVSVSGAKVQGLYSDIPLNSKATGRVIYTRNDKKLYYFYNSTWTTFDANTNLNVQPGYYTDCLVLDTSFKYDNPVGRQQGEDESTIRGAFYHLTFADSADTGVPYIAAPFVTTAAAEVDEFVVDDLGVGVVDDADELVVAADGSVSNEGVAFLMLQRNTVATTTTTDALFGKLQSINLQDWASIPAFTISFISTAITGVQTASNAAAIKNAPYLFFVLKPTEVGIEDNTGVDINQGGCFVRTAWDFSTGPNNPKYSGQTQIYIPNRFGNSGPNVSDDAFNAVWFKHRVRGRGHSMQVIFENDGDKDFEIAGWGQNFYGKR